MSNTEENKDELQENSKISYKEKIMQKWTNEEVQNWKIEKVVEWLKSLEITKDNQEMIKNFEENVIDGKALLLLTQDDLKNDLEINQLGKIPNIKYRNEKKINGGDRKIKR
jgi:hypothetical protein